MLISACKSMFSKRDNLCELKAYFKPKNLPSIKSFIKAGFIFSKTVVINQEEFNLYLLHKQELVGESYIYA